MSTEDENNDQDGPAVWADAPQPIPPPMRTFKVVAERWVEPTMTIPDAAIYVDAHSVTCEGDTATFYVYRPEGVMLVAYAIRVLRPYLDIEDVSAQMATTSKTMN